jgi:YegS/Rv2252/BmrU family lipid kinase
LHVGGNDAAKTSQRALLLVNRKASRACMELGPALAALRQGGIELIEPHGNAKTKFSDLIQAHRGKIDLIVIGGGDGTLNAAADALAEAKTPLGILPLGTANDLARTLDIPTDLAAAVEVIRAGKRRDIDLGWVNGKHFFNVASLGLSTAITQRLSRQTKSRWGVFAYFLAAAKVLMRARPFTVEISGDDGTKLARSVQITVGNGRHFGGGMTVDEEARIDDGVLHLYSLEIERWWQLLPIIPSLRKGTLAGTPHVRTMRGRQFTVRPLYVQRSVNTDGEITSRTPCEFRLIPRALSVLVP